MIGFEVGARVEVYDGDRMRWCPGTVQSTELAADRTSAVELGDLIVVRSDSEIEHGLPLTFVVPVTAADKLIRRYRQHVPVDCWCGQSRGHL